MDRRRFCHQHVQAEYSLLDGSAGIGELVAACAQMQMPVLPITDHGGMHGAIESDKAWREHGVKPVIRAEVCAQPPDRGGT